MSAGIGAARVAEPVCRLQIAGKPADAAKRFAIALETLATGDPGTDVGWHRVMPFEDYGERRR